VLPPTGDTRAKLQHLLKGDLNFHGEHGRYASHDVHAFAAKFPPQLPRAFIHGLTQPGALVLDPMMGSGTTVVEAFLAGRYGIGLDIDPLALRLSCAKTTPIDREQLQTLGRHVLLQARTDLAAHTIDVALAQRLDVRTRAFVDYWFLPTTQRELMALALAIQQVTDTKARRLLELTFSSIIITKSGGVSRARDLAHSRPHFDQAKQPKNALEQFAIRWQKNLQSMAGLIPHGPLATPLAGDARAMPLGDASMDLIVTSPPYANAIDYMRAHKFALVWFGQSIADLAKLRTGYVGSEYLKDAPRADLPASAEASVRQVAQYDDHKARILRKYFVEMTFICAEMLRVLRHDACAIVVVGTSVMRGINVQTHQCLADIAATLGFDVVGIVQRVLDRDKRMMPARFGKKTDSMIEQRMHEEYVLGLLKV
jgi:DNA modification methylase